MKIYRQLPELPDHPIALTIGNFDGVHLGHQAMVSVLKTAARRRKLPACVMTFEPHPREIVGGGAAPPRLTTMEEKAALLESVGVERLYVCRFDAQMAALAPLAFVTELLVGRLGVKWLLVGDDFRFGARRTGDFELLSRHADVLGFEVEAMPTVTVLGERVSSSAVRQAWAQGDQARMAALLGRPQPRATGAAA